MIDFLYSYNFFLRELQKMNADEIRDKMNEIEQNRINIDLFRRGVNSLSN